MDLIECPYCKKEFNSKMRLCPFCGGEYKRPVTVNDPVCPRCGCGLESSQYRGEELSICPKCSGIWLDTSEFKYLTSERDVYKDETIAREYLKKPSENEIKYAKCVRCVSFMRRKMFKKISGVIVDMCRDHGVWLDAGELEQIRCFIANGGLEQYQEYLDNKITKNHNDIRKLARETNSVKFVQKMTHLYNPRYWLFKLLF